jgi:hypothetical protein
MSVPGMMYPTLKGMPAGNPRDAAITNMNNAAAIQAQANNAVGGRKRMRSRRSRKGGASNIAVPQFNMSYEPQGGPGTNPNDQIASNAQVGTQGAANSALDAGAFKKGGSKRSGSKRSGSKRSRRSRKGGNPDWVWGCSSGGKRSRRSKRSNRKRKSSKKRY